MGYLNTDVAGWKRNEHLPKVDKVYPLWERKEFSDFPVSSNKMFCNQECSYLSFVWKVFCSQSLIGMINYENCVGQDYTRLGGAKFS